MHFENKTLFLFTSGYPYGKKKEPFLENEIDYLSKAFSKIIIFPKHKPSDLYRKIPENVTINNCLADADLKLKKIYLIKNLFFVLHITLQSATKLKCIKRFWRNYKFLLDTLAIEITHGKVLEKELKYQNLEQVVFYDYWFFNSIFTIAFLKRKKTIKKLICRAHGFDVYDFRWKKIKHVPFLRFRIKTVDNIYCISKHGSEYLKKHTAINFHKKIEISYLGVGNPAFEVNKIDSKDKFTIVSCSRVVSLKRTHIIPEVLAKINIPIRWIHIGDGPLYNLLKENSAKLPANISVELKGYVSNKYVCEFYRKNQIDLFLSLSLSEGLPVSMMEAISYGIPIVSTNVGGVSEIVNETTGLLLDKNASIKDIAIQITDFLKYNKLNRKIITDFYDKYFNADKNFSKFVEKIIQ